MQTDDLQRYVSALTKCASTDDALAVFAWTLAERIREGNLDRTAFKGRLISALDGAWKYQEMTKRIAA